MASNPVSILRDSSFFSFVPAITTVPPASCNDFAIASPIPPEPPEIKATLPSNSLFS